MKLLLGDSLEVLKTLEANSVDSVVTDAPYELGFMGRAWDKSGIAYNVELWQSVLRVLKPGGHLLAFGGTRTYHRMTCAIEDAGFEIRDCIQWLYGSGFPKSMDVSKAIDKAAGAEREVIGREVYRKNDSNHAAHSINIGQTDEGKCSRSWDITSPATEAAKQWQGWGTALKPANEPIVLARKPLSEKTVAKNVLKFGTGALNVDASRIGVNASDSIFAKNPNTQGGFGHASASVYGESDGAPVYDPSQGRWPANVLFDEEAAAALDEQTGNLPGPWGKDGAGKEAGQGSMFGVGGVNSQNELRGKESGGASRFFYVAKSSRKERNAGLEGMPVKQSIGGGGGIGDYLEDVDSASGKFGSEKAPAANHHPTVKPIKLMEYLIRMITPPGGVCLDPFMGSGTTGCAAVKLGFDFIGIEREPEYLAIAEKRIANACVDPKQLDLEGA